MIAKILILVNTKWFGLYIYIYERERERERERENLIR